LNLQAPFFEICAAISRPEKSWPDFSAREIRVLTDAVMAGRVPAIDVFALPRL